MLTGVTLEVPARGVTALIGSNGSGKTTLLRTLLGLLPPRRGQVEYGPGPDGRPHPPRIGYVQQIDVSEVLFPVTALDVVLMGLTPELGILGRPRAPHRERAAEALRLLAADALAGRPFRSLSGGQRQRVMLARALVADPELLVLDEPVRGLDLASAAQLMALIVSLAAERGIAVLVATHALDLVATHADQIALFRDGRVRSGPAQLIFTDEVLSEFHGRPLVVREVEGQRVVVPSRAP
ncbi:MAG: metal ABC transporter ATP-binding protein [Planctomycetota bacterium]